MEEKLRYPDLDVEQFWKDDGRKPARAHARIPLPL